MQRTNRRLTPATGPLTARRRAIDIKRTELVRVDPLGPDHSLPLVATPTTDRVDLASWIRENRDKVLGHLQSHGGLLFRGFDVQPSQMEHMILAFSEHTLEYKERSSPRTHQYGHVYTSTEYPPDFPIFLHNESSYAHTWPLRIFFLCAAEPTTGGETPIADVRRVYDRIPEAYRTSFEGRGVLYVRNFSEGLGLPWQTVFQTTNRQEVEAYCRTAGYDVEWRTKDRLRTRRVGPAVLHHPHTREAVWFNHAAFFHVSTLDPRVREALLATVDEEDLPNNTYYGDGEPIESPVLEAIRDAYNEETVTFGWRRGDLLMLDNMLVAHGRAAFSGPRKVLVGMCDPLNVDSL